MKTESLLLIILIAFLSCNSKKQENRIEEKKVLINSSAMPKTDLLVSQEQNSPKIVEYNTLLQGKWQSDEDEKSYLVFEGKNRKDIYVGENVDESEEFELSNSCLNDGDKNQATSGKDQVYMSVKKSDMCWHIVNLDKEYLTLNYTARGNDLRYTKVKK